MIFMIFGVEKQGYNNMLGVPKRWKSHWASSSGVPGVEKTRHNTPSPPTSIFVSISPPNPPQIDPKRGT